MSEQQNPKGYIHQVNKVSRQNSANSKRMYRKNNLNISSKLNLQSNHLSKNKTKQTQNIKYTPINTPLKNRQNPINQLTDLNQDKKDLDQNNQNKQDQSISNKSANKPKQRIISTHDSSEYYKFWKNKANEYQAMNFNLQRVNSALEQQLEILRHHNQKLIKKIKKQEQMQEQQQDFDDPLGKQKMQKFYKHKIEALTKKIEDQQRVIRKQDQKLKELSKQMSENYQLKGFLQNMEDRVSEIESFQADKKSLSSRKNSVRQIPITPHLSINNIQNKSYTNIRTPRTNRYMVAEDLRTPSNQNYSQPQQNPRLIHKSRSNCNLEFHQQKVNQLF